MTSLKTSYLENSDRFAAVVDTGGDWAGQSPCEKWNAADVLDHVVDTQRDFLTQRGADIGERPTGSPSEVWSAHDAAVRRLVDDEDFARTEYDGWFGRTTALATLSTFYGFDLLVHRWDLARGLGQGTAFDADELDRIEEAMAGFGEQLYTEGVCKPAIDVPDEASREDKILGRLGRRA